MDLDPGIKAYIAQAEAADHQGEGALSLAELRASYAAFSRAYDRPHPPGLVVTDGTVPGPAGDIPVRVYRPGGNVALPGILYLHGGGWVLGSIDTHDSITADLSDRTGAVVVSVDYRLAPENPFPAAVDDGYAALCHVAANAGSLGIDPDRIAVAGDSAGANLAAAIALMARDRDGPQLCGQALVYPALGTDFDLPSYRENAEAPMLTREAMIAYWGHYLAGDPAAADPYAAPLKAASLAGLPPAFITTAYYDPLRDDGERYAERLQASGVPVELRCAGRLVHGHLRARYISDDAAAEFDALCVALKRFASPPC